MLSYFCEVKTTANPVSFSKRNIPPYCGKSGKYNCPHSSKTTKDHIVRNQIHSSSLNISSTLIITISANNQSSQNTVPVLQKSHPKLHVGALNIQTLYHIEQQASLVRTLEFRVIDAFCLRSAHTLS